MENTSLNQILGIKSHREIK